MHGSPWLAGVAAASTYNQRGVMTPIPNEASLGLTRCTRIDKNSGFLISLRCAEGSLAVRRSPSEGTMPAIHCGRQVISTRTGISFLTGSAKSDGGSILKLVSVAGIVPDIRIWFP
jgi:hypothetical protein